MTTPIASSLVQPARVASVFDWKKVGTTLMALDIRDTSIGIAIAPHPSSTKQTPLKRSSNVIQQLQQINIGKDDKMQKHAAEKLTTLAAQYDACAFVVSWPLQPEGRPGRACGRVLHVSEHLAQGTDPVFTKNRPFTLWDERRREINSNEPDRWGRSKDYAGVSASPAEYSSASHVEACSDSSGAALVLKDFVENHWKCSQEPEPVEKVEVEKNHEESHVFERLDWIVEGGDSVDLSRLLI